jgi:hypothetical protein
MTRHRFLWLAAIVATSPLRGQGAATRSTTAAARPAAAPAKPVRAEALPSKVD